MEDAAGAQLCWPWIRCCQTDLSLNNSETRVMLVVSDLLLLLKQLALAPAQLPVDQFQDVPTPLQHLLTGCRLLWRALTPPNLASFLPGARLPHHHSDIAGDTCLSSTRWSCGWQGFLMTALGVCLTWTELFWLSRNTTALTLPTSSGNMRSALRHARSSLVSGRKCLQASAHETPKAASFAWSWKEHFW